MSAKTHIWSKKTIYAIPGGVFYLLLFFEGNLYYSKIYYVRRGREGIFFNNELNSVARKSNNLRVSYEFEAIDLDSVPSSSVNNGITGSFGETVFSIYKSFENLLAISCATDDAKFTLII